MGLQRTCNLIPGFHPYGRLVDLTLFFGLEQPVQGLDRDLELVAAGLGGGEVSLQEVAYYYRGGGLAEDEPGFGDEDELKDGVAPPRYQRVEEGCEDNVEQDVRPAAGVDAAAVAGVLERHLTVPLVGGDGFVFGPVVAADGGELHSREEDEQDRQDGECREEGEDAAKGSHPAPELHQAHKEPEDGQCGREEEQTPDGSEDLGEDPAPEKERTYYRPAGDALYGWVRGPSQDGGFDLDVDLPLPAMSDTGVVRAEEVEPVPTGHPTKE